MQQQLSLNDNLRLAFNSPLADIQTIPTVSPTECDVSINFIEETPIINSDPFLGRYIITSPTRFIMQFMVQGRPAEWKEFIAHFVQLHADKMNRQEYVVII